MTQALKGPTNWRNLTGGVVDALLGKGGALTGVLPGGSTTATILDATVGGILSPGKGNTASEGAQTGAQKGAASVIGDSMKFSDDKGGSGQTADKTGDVSKTSQTGTDNNTGGNHPQFNDGVGLPDVA